MPGLKRLLEYTLKDKRVHDHNTANMKKNMKRSYFCDLAIGWRRLSTNDEILSVGPSQPDMIGLPTGVGL